MSSQNTSTFQSTSYSSYTDSSGNPQTGTVSSVQFTSSGPTLTIGSATGISLSSITGAS